MPSQRVVVSYLLLLTWSTVLVNARGITTVVCNVTDFNWMFNKEGQSPCEVAANLSSVCSTTGDYTLSPLQPTVVNNFYTPSNLNTPCECSNVDYSMTAGCSLCQGGVATTWDFWSKNCSTVKTDGFPHDLPSGTFVPAWAFLDVVSSNRIDLVAAKALASNPESSAVSSTTQTSTSQTSTSQTSTGATNRPQNDNTSSHSSLSGGAIAGIVFGAIALLLLSGIGVMVYLRKQKGSDGRERRRSGWMYNAIPNPWFNRTNEGGAGNGAGGRGTGGYGDVELPGYSEVDPWHPGDEMTSRDQPAASASSHNISIDPFNPSPSQPSQYYSRSGKRLPPLGSSSPPSTAPAGVPSSSSGLPTSASAAVPSSSSSVPSSSSQQQRRAEKSGVLVDNTTTIPLAPMQLPMTVTPAAPRLSPPPPPGR